MVELKLGDMPGFKRAIENGVVDFDLPTGPSRSRVNWGTVWGAVGAIVAVTGVVFGLFGSYHEADKALDRRVSTLETQRVEDVQHRNEQRNEDLQWRQGVNESLQRILERLPRQ